MNYRKLTPSMSLLLAFEASARHESFTRAAEELSLTQSAVSRQVQALEEEIEIDPLVESDQVDRDFQAKAAHGFAERRDPELRIAACSRDDGHREIVVLAERVIKEWAARLVERLVFAVRRDSHDHEWAGGIAGHQGPPHSALAGP